MNCPHCGKETLPERNFCQVCGRVIVDLKSIRFGRVLHSDSVEAFMASGDPNVVSRSKPVSPLTGRPL